MEDFAAFIDEETRELNEQPLDEFDLGFGDAL